MKQALADLREFHVKAWEVAAFLTLSVASVFLEAIGIGVFLPVFQFINENGDVHALVATSALWARLVDVYGLLGLQVTLLTLLTTAFSCFLLRQVFVYVRVTFEWRLREKVIYIKRQELFSSYLDAATDLHDRLPSGTLVNSIVKEMDRAITAVFGPVAMIATVMILFIYLAVLAVVSWEMTIAALGIAVIAVFCVRNLIVKSRQAGDAVTESNAKISAFIVERFRSPRLVRLSQTEEAEKGELASLTMRLRENMVFSNALTARGDVVLEPIFIGLSCLLLFVAYQFLQLGIEEIGIYLVVGVRLIPIAKTIVRQKQSILNNAASLDIVKTQHADMNEHTERNSGEKRIGALNQGINFENVEYSYPSSDVPAIQRCHFVIPAKQFTALVGPSGSGKSTIVDLIPRLRNPTSGRILFDGVDAREISLTSLRRAISYAPQSPQIFSGTIRQHILYGYPEADEAAVIEAAKQADAHEFIVSLPHGYDTTINDGGTIFSGGQRQRLDLARALVRRSPILIMDEPTSDLDVDSEIKFRNALMSIRERGDTTIIVVAHRLATVRLSDQIVVVENGCVASCGTHDQLMTQSNWYSSAIAKSG